MNTTDFTEFAALWGVTLPKTGAWTDLLPLVERVCEAKQGYFIFKIDGERQTRKYTFALNLPRPTGVVLRKDTDSIEDGLVTVVQELRASGVHPKD
jgi:hypothetical protein